MIATAEQETSLWTTPGSQLYVQYEQEARKTISAGLVLNEITIRPYSVFVGHLYFQHAGVGWRGNHALRYHMYLIPDDIQMKDFVYYSYNRSFRKEGERPPSRPVSENHSEQSIHNESDDGSSSEDLEIRPLGRTDPVYGDIDGISQG